MDDLTASAKPRLRPLLDHFSKIRSWWCAERSRAATTMTTSSIRAWRIWGSCGESKIFCVSGFREGGSVVGSRISHGAKNIAVLRHFALNLVRRVADKRSIKRRRKRAAWDPIYLL
jgi:hypothetical protein